MASVDDIEELITTRKLNGVNDGLFDENDKNVVNMTEEAFNEIIDNFEVVAYLTEYGRRGIKENVKKLQARIKELENKLKDINAYILTNGIDEPLKTATQIQVENQQHYIIQQKINLLEKKLKNSIPTQKVKDLIINETINISGFECIAVEDLEELLEENK